MKVVILAAGLGSRLERLTLDIPKCLIDVGGEPLISYSISAVAAENISEVTIVTGHCDDKICDFVVQNFPNIKFNFIYNEIYASTGSVVSLLRAFEQISDEPVLVLESDILYDKRFISVALRQEKSTMFVADITGSGDEVYICGENGGVLEFLGKDAPKEYREKSLGEFSGITVICPELKKLFQREAREMLTANNAEGHYEELLFNLSSYSHKHNVYVQYCEGYPWTEIDTAADLKRARSKVLPSLVENGDIAGSQGGAC